MSQLVNTAASGEYLELDAEENKHASLLYYAGPGTLHYFTCEQWFVQFLRHCSERPYFVVPYFVHEPFLQSFTSRISYSPESWSRWMCRQP
jgi:hypothetical protein